MLPLPAKTRLATYAMVAGAVVGIFLIGLLVAFTLGESPAGPEAPGPLTDPVPAGGPISP